MDLATILNNAQSPDANIRKAAEEALTLASQENFASFIYHLSLELMNEERTLIIRQLAGIVLKNSIYSNDPQRFEVISKQWTSLPENQKNEIKKNLLATLPSVVYEARHTAGQVISKIALIELPYDQWPTLAPQLFDNITQPNENLKQSTLQTIGYICEEINPEVMLQHADRILTIIVHGMRDPSNPVKLAATNALCNSLEFVRNNFEKKQERDEIMRVIFETCNSTDAGVKKAAFENLVKIAVLYYEQITEYMTDIYTYTVKAIQSETNDDIVLQAIEFWTSLSEEEIGLQDDNLSQGLTLKALPSFTPVILTTLTKQDEHDPDTWNVAMAGATCLTYMASNVLEPILEFIVPYIRQNIVSPDWRLREASCVALGSVLEGPTEFQGFLADVVPVLLQHMKDPHEMVKDTSSWTLGRLCAHQIDAVGELLEQILTAMLESTKDPSPKVAAHACWGIHNVCQAFETGPVGQVSSLAAIFQVLAKHLYIAAHRPDASEESLRVNAYEAMNSLISFSSADKAMIIEVLKFVLTDFESSFAMEVVNQTDLDTKTQIQSLLCSTLQTIASVIKEDITPFVEKMVYLLLTVFNTKNAVIYEEALMAIGAIIQAIEGGFKPYIVPAFLDILKSCLRNVEIGEVSNIAIGIVSDLTRALGKEFTVLARDIIPLIIQDLTDPKISMSAKPNAVTCIGDIAFAIGSDFVQFLPMVMPILEQATLVNLDDRDYLNTLRESIFQAYTEIVHGLKSGGCGDQFTPYVGPVLTFVSLVYNDYMSDIQGNSPLVLSGAIGLLGDLAQTLGEAIKPTLKIKFVKELFEMGHNHDSMREVADWADECVFK
eukprot:gene16149-19216_t